MSAQATHVKLFQYVFKLQVGVFTADFLDENGTTVSVRDGHSTILNCNVYLRHDKTVSQASLAPKSIQWCPIKMRIFHQNEAACFAPSFL